MKVDENSMLIWYPQIKNLPIPQPKTRMLIIKYKVLVGWVEKPIPKKMESKINKMISDIEAPLFLRTDLASGKHGWKDSCFVQDKENIFKHIKEVLDANFCADMIGLFCNALIFREYIEMATGFTAFYGKMPVNPERRYFIRNGKIEDYYSYWIKEAIETPSRDDWEEVLAEMNEQTKEEISLLSGYANQICKVFPRGYWSIDFCKAKDGRWILIDMATGERSWHPKRNPN